MWNSKGKKKFLAIKVDLEKAYDRIKWSFLHDTLIKAGFPNDLINIITNCVTTVSMRVLWNGEPFYAFKPTRGLR